MKLTATAEAVLQKRYYLEGEDWDALCSRVAEHVANMECDADEYEQRFFEMIYNLDFLPNSPCLMNAGTPLGGLSACFVLPIEDNLGGIFETIKNGALVNKTGGGTGYSFSRLRAKNSSVCSTNGVASGPISFAKVFDVATDVIKQGGRRRGANMGVLRVDHPDILEFIECKRTPGMLTNFNLSVAITDEFMNAVKEDLPYSIVDPAVFPEYGKKVNTYSARWVFDKIIDAAWDNGEPGILFIDAANRGNPTPWLGDFEATNPCGEQWLLPYESCNLGSINLARFLDRVNGIDCDRLTKITKLAVRFLDNVVDASTYPIYQIVEATKKTRKIGLGIMGLHDMLIKMGIPYGSHAGRETASRVMRIIKEAAVEESMGLAIEKGQYPGSVGLFNDGRVPQMMRNAALTSIQPTGTVSMIANCSSGCEPYFAVVTRKDVMDGQQFYMVNALFKEIGTKEGWYTDELLEEVAASGTVIGNNKIPEDWQAVFACAQDISVDDHILMQAALQNSGIDASISKTINMPATATKDDVKDAYIKAWDYGCKGLTVYRDGSRSGQVLNVGKAEEKKPITVGYNEESGWQVVNSSEPFSAGKQELPDVIDAKRFKLKDKDGQNIYVMICFDEFQKPAEVFAKFPFDHRIDLLEKATMWSTVCRLISLALRYGVPVEEVIKQLDRASGSMFDLPAQLSKILKSFMAKTDNGYDAGNCPDCKTGKLIFQEGCLLCPDCAYSKCS